MNTTLEVRTPPDYCQYAAGACDQSFSDTPERRAVFLYPSKPETIAATISAAVEEFRREDPDGKWRTWSEFKTAGQVIFCTICKNMRFSETIVADVTTLNFNLLFEIGFALGLERPVVPIRDTSYLRDKRIFDELGLLDTIGYVDFQNSAGLRASLVAKFPVAPIPSPTIEINDEAPLYVLKGHIDTEGAVKLMSTLKKSKLRFRTYDILETPRLSLHEARRQVGASLGVVAHLLSPERAGAEVHNARCALLAGVAMALGKTVSLLQEGYADPQPVDYRDLILSYRTPDQVPKLMQPFILKIVEDFQSKRPRSRKVSPRLLERLDLGDVAAENEIRPLKSYFVRTAQFNDARRAHGRLVTGRKGAGKTAIFYAVRDAIGHGHSRLVLDLKPEGHQFTKFREVVLSKLSPGLQEHTLIAFWNYILLCEMAHKVLDYEYSWAQRDEERARLFEALKTTYERHLSSEQGDFSERLLKHVDRLTGTFDSSTEALRDGRVTELLFKDDIRDLDNVVGAYLRHKDEVWVLVDNLDKGWPTRGAKSEDILILRALLEASRKMEQQLEARGLVFHALVFLRNDIYEQLVIDTPDRGKDTPITLDWDDPELLKELVRQRVAASTELTGTFEEVWPQVFESHVGVEESFTYMLERTLMRPRDLLNFLKRAIEVAINRGQTRVRTDDILKAEARYSNDILYETSFEISDTQRSSSDILYVFLGCRSRLSKTEVLDLLSRASIPRDQLEPTIQLLLWFGFLGTQETGQEGPRFAYMVRYNLAKLLAPVEQSRASFVIHPAFRVALECQEV